MQGSTTRRRLLQGLAVGAIGSTAGCTAESLGDQSGTPTESSSKDVSPNTESDSYSVTMAPMGEVTFEEVPQKWLVGNGSYADMGLALGLDAPAGLLYWDYFSMPYYDEISGVSSFDKSKVINLHVHAGFSPEAFYEIAADIHIMDPIHLVHQFKSIEREDIKRIKQNIGPFVGNSNYRDGEAWHDYRHYTLYGAFGKIAVVFQQQERYSAFSKLHDAFQQTIETHLPPEPHPSVALLFTFKEQPEKFWPYTIGSGTSSKQWRDLEVRDALGNAGVTDSYEGGGTIDYETLLAIDPDILMIRGFENYTSEKFQNTVVQFMKNHPVASNLSAVEASNVFRGGPFHQGPIHNLVLTERAANQVYPDVFSGVTLYDPQRVSDIVHGRF